MKTSFQNAFDFSKWFFKEKITIRNIPNLQDMPSIISTIKEHSDPNAGSELGRKLFYTESIERKNLALSNCNLIKLKKEAHRAIQSILNRIDKIL